MLSTPRPWRPSEVGAGDRTGADDDLGTVGPEPESSTFIGTPSVPAAATASSGSIGRGAAAEDELRPAMAAMTASAASGLGGGGGSAKRLATSGGANRSSGPGGGPSKEGLYEWLFG